MTNNQFTSSLIILFLAGVIVAVYPLIHSHIPLLKTNFKTYSAAPYFKSKVKPDVVTLKDSLPQLDSSSTSRDTLLAKGEVVNNYDFDVSHIQLEDYQGIEFISSFYEALRTSEKQVRIAYFGDSSIEGDLISQTVRDSFQRRFGGDGVGFVPITSRTNGFRRSVQHRFSNNWYHAYIGKSNSRNKRRGISGEYFLTSSKVTIDTIRIDSLDRDSIIVNTPDPNYWVSYRPANLNPGTKKISSARLFYGTPNFNDSTAYDKVAGQVTIKADTHIAIRHLPYQALVNQLTLTASACEKLILNFQVPSSLPLYGVSLESPRGVIVDNFSSRGNLGPGLKYISKTVLQDFQYFLNYDLIILQFGLNVTDPKLRRFEWYEKDMMQTIQHFKDAFPGVAIVIIGPSDKSSKLGGTMRTDPSVPLINQCLQKVAMQSEVAFFSLYEAMGGENSMVDWVEKKKPRLANYDYTHFNFRGAAIVGGLVYDYLLQGY